MARYPAPCGIGGPPKKEGGVKDNDDKIIWRKTLKNSYNYVICLKKTGQTKGVILILKPTSEKEVDRFEVSWQNPIAGPTDAEKGMWILQARKMIEKIGK